MNKSHKYDVNTQKENKMYITVYLNVLKQAKIVYDNRSKKNDYFLDRNYGLRLGAATRENSKLPTMYFFQYISF